ncbi:hypothetical protein VUR80DRAFT_3361 [Thermomyces stellatus]
MCIAVLSGYCGTKRHVDPWVLVHGVASFVPRILDLRGTFSPGEGTLSVSVVARVHVHAGSPPRYPAGVGAPSPRAAEREAGAARVSRLHSRFPLSPANPFPSPNFRFSVSCCRELLWTQVLHDSPKIILSPVPAAHPTRPSPKATSASRPRPHTNHVLSHSSFIQHPDFALDCARTHPSVFPSRPPS